MVSRCFPRGASSEVQAKSSRHDDPAILALHLSPGTARASSLRLTKAVRSKIHQLARDFAVPSIDDRFPGCDHCADLDKNGNSRPERVIPPRQNPNRRGM